MNKNINKILLYLEDIKGYVSSYIFYVNNPNNNLDKSEINMYIFSIPEIVDSLKELILDEKE